MNQRIKFSTLTEKSIVGSVKQLSYIVIFIVLFRLYVLDVMVVKQASMFPTLSPNDKVAILKPAYLFNNPARGDIVVVKAGKNTGYTKRVVGLPNETIEIKNNCVYIDGLALDEPYLPPKLAYPDFGAARIPDGCYFVMGDNRTESIDSRDKAFGFVEKKNVTSRVCLRVSTMTPL
ncbi:MAG: signal peptidase I [Eubacteriaceae bacterium]|nr:signal peptidase I [Eubacteriaceae bacterium]